MKYFVLSFFLFLSTLPPEAFSRKRGGYSQSSSNRKRGMMRANIQLKRTLTLIKKKEYSEGVKKLFLIVKNPHLKKRRTEIRYILGKSFEEMNFLHAAALQFLLVLKTGDRKYSRLSLERLSEIAARTGDSKILEFAVSKGGSNKIRGKYRHLVHFQFGKYEMARGNSRQAASYFKKIPYSSPFYGKARYYLGLSYAERGRPNQAVRAFSNILSKEKNLTNPLRVAALMGTARAYYQAGKWDLSSDYYRRIPRDTSFWHDMLFERSWAFLRGGKFRSAMNGFQTLHSSYYDDLYQPGSLLLRSIVYMYICKYQEMEKVLDLFKNTYSPVRRRVKRILSSSSKLYYTRLIQSLNSEEGWFPKVIAQRIYREMDFQNAHNHIVFTNAQKALMRKMSYSWRSSQAGRYALRLANEKLKESKRQADRAIRKHLRFFEKDLKNFFTQEQYLRYESLRGKRYRLKQKISDKGSGKKIIQDVDRDFFVQNGFEFYPFQGEYWLDELGNYHYVALQNCR